MTDAVIVAAARTPIGRSHKGSLVDVDAFALAESLQGGGVIARHTAVRVGLVHVAGLADNRHCAAGLSAVQIAAGSILAGMDRVVIAGGTESLSSMPHTLESVPASAREFRPWMSASHPATPDATPWDMSITVGENTAREVGISRRDADEWAVWSHQRAAASVDSGWFDAEVVPATVTTVDGSARVVARDEHPRRDTTLERRGALARLNPELGDSVITAGNAAGLNDAAAAVMVTMLHELARRGGGLGCVSMCAGGGMGSALVLEVAGS